MYGQIQVRFVKSDFSDQFWEKKVLRTGLRELNSSELDFVFLTIMHNYVLQLRKSQLQEKNSELWDKLTIVG